LFFKDARNFHSPEGILTNKGIGYVEHTDNTVPGSNEWRLLSWLLRDDGRHLVGVANGEFFDQGNLSGVWISKKTGLSATEKWISKQYREDLFLVNGVDTPSVYDGTTFNDWFIIEAATIAAPTDSGSGSFSAAVGYRYLYFYKRSSDGFLSPASPLSVTTGVFSNSLQVDVPLTSKTTQGVDLISIYRTTDGGATFRFLVDVSSSVSTYADSTDDTVLSLIEAPTITSISDLQFTMCEVLGDRIYFAGIIEEGTARPTRVRWTYPGQPWRVEALAFTDEIEEVVSAMLKVRGGLVVFNPNEAQFVRHIGGGAHDVESMELPGAHDRFSVQSLQDGAAWFDGSSVYVATQREGFLDLGDPVEPGNADRSTLSGASVEAIFDDVIDWDSSWISYHLDNDYVVCGLTFNGTSPDALLIFDRARRAWWRIEYGGAYPVQVPANPQDRATKNLLIGQVDGSLITAFSGNNANGSVLKPKAEANPLDFNMAQQKRFRYVDVFWDVVAAITLQVSWFLDVQRATQTSQVSLLASGDVLDDTFFLDQSIMGGESRLSNRFRVGKVGDYLSFIVEETIGLNQVTIPRIDLYFQESPRRRP